MLRGERERERERASLLSLCVYDTFRYSVMKAMVMLSGGRGEEKRERELNSLFFFWYALTVSIMKAYSTLLCIFIVSVILLGVALFYLLWQLQVCT